MKLKLIALGVLFSLPLLFSSCRSCKGGGWYGDRNLNIDQCAVETTAIEETTAAIE